MKAVTLLLLTVALCGLASRGEAADRMRGWPPLMLWAWERPEDLSEIDPDEAGVAYLAWTFRLKGAGVESRPRRQPLKVPARTVLVAVSRIEVDHGAVFAGADSQRDRIVETVLGTLNSRVSGIQIDFDARVSERDFYRRLLLLLRQRMDPAMPLTITSLASWALFDTWIGDLPVDEAVPMAFSMGADAPAVRAWIGAGRDFREPLARRATGVCLEEPLPRLPGRARERRLYVFTLRSWTSESLARAMGNYR